MKPITKISDVTLAAKVKLRSTRDIILRIAAGRKSVAAKKAMDLLRGSTMNALATQKIANNYHLDDYKATSNKQEAGGAIKSNLKNKPIIVR